MNTKDTLLTLSSLCAIGTVTDASDKAFEVLSEYTECARIGNLSVIGKLKGESNYTLMLDAHIDEVGFVVTDIDDNGFLTVAKCGGIDLRTLPARVVTVHGKEKITAVFCSTPPHLSDKEREYKDISKIKLDTMLGIRAKDVISIGDYVTYNQYSAELLGGKITGKSLDDRAGVVCLLELAKRLKDKTLPFNVVFVLSDGEELGLRGAKTTSFKIEADEAIAIDVSFGDGPDISPDDCGKLGDGAMIGVSPCLDGEISKKLINIANENGFKYQTEVMGGNTSTNADVISVTKSGIKTGLVSIPLRNMHTDIEVIDMADILNVCDLLEAYILGGGVFNA